MNEEQRYLLKWNKKRICQDLLVSDVFSHLLSTFAIEDEEVEIIQGEITSRRKAEKLVETILGHSNNHFQHFYDALIYAEYDHLAQLLKQGVSGNNPKRIGSSGESDDDEDALPDVKTILRDGGVPRLPQVFVKRPSCSASLQKALYEVKDHDSCVILHGMAGCGKTILAIDVLNDEQLIRSCFPGGVFWVMVGNLSDMKLLMKMQNLCALMDPTSNRAPRNLEEAKDRLRKLFSQEHPRSLLVLDDLWLESQMKYFDIRVRTLVTTRNSAIADRINCHKIKVPLSETMSVKQSRAIFSQWTNYEESQLPSEADQIIKECKGYPLAVSMIGALLKSHSSRWSYYLSQLQERKTSKVKSKLSYTYDSLFDAFAVSLDSLSSDIQDKYQMLAVFELGVDIPFEAVSVLWDMDDIECEDLILELVDKSLVHMKTNDIYFVHNVQMGFLLEHARNSSKLVEYHKLLIERYSLHCKGKFERLKDDSYIHWHLISHLVKAGKIVDAVSLCCSFAWLQQAVMITTSSNVIGDFNEVIEQVTNNALLHNSLGILKQLRQFFGAYSHLVASKSVNLIQLALCQPFSKDICQLALQEIGESKESAKLSKWYILWKNRPECVNDGLQLTSQLHNGGVKNGRYSSVTDHCVVSCSEDQTIRVWNSSTGEETHIFRGHTDIVNYSEFTPDDQHIVSCSADKSIRVWSVGGEMELCSMEGHTEEVMCCRCSPNGQFIVSCSLDQTVKVWNFETKFLKDTMRGHTDVVNWCCFSNDSTRIASASNDCTVIVWDFASDEIVATFYAVDFMSFCLFVEDDKLLCTYLNYIEMFSITNDTSLWCLEAPSDVISLDMSPNGKFLAASHNDMTASLIEISTRVFAKSYVGHSSWVNSVSFSLDGCNVLTTSHDGLCKVWKVDDNSSSFGALTEIFDAVLTSEGHVIITATRSNTVREIYSNGTTFDSEQFQSKISSCAISTSGKTIAAGLNDGKVKILKSNNGGTQSTLVNHSEEVTKLKFYEDLRLLSSCDKHCTVWCLKNHVVLSAFENHSDSITSCQFISNGNSVLSSSYDGTIVVWSCTDGTPILTRHHNEEESAAVLSCHVSNNGGYIISCCADSTCKLWSVPQGSLALTVEDHEDAVRCGAFSSDDAMFATGSDDGTVKVWCAVTGNLICDCEDHDGWIVDVRFNERNDQMLTLSADVKWFDMDGVLLQTFHVCGSSLRSIYCTMDFDRYITIDNLGYLYILEKQETLSK